MRKAAALLLLTLGSSGLKSPDCQTRANVPRIKLHCSGVTLVSTSFTPSGPKVKQEPSKDEIWITSGGSRLLVQINPQAYATLDERTKNSLQKALPYRIVGVTGEGLTAIHLAAETSEQTLILKSNLTEALLIETAFSFLPPQSEPESETIAFSCKRA